MQAIWHHAFKPHKYIRKYSVMFWAKELGLKKSFEFFHATLFSSSLFELEKNSTEHKSFNKAVQGAAQ